MSKDIIHVYLMPGLAASPKIFEYLKLSEEQFEMHYLEWIIPELNESISDYAMRMTKIIKHENIVLLGVSFGGIIVQEMSKHINLRKLIVVSSVKTKYELPKRMKFIKITRAYKLLPAKLLSNIDVLIKYAFGEMAIKRIELYKKYLAVNDINYMKWAIKNMICWEQNEILPETIHIHGDKDAVFPISHIQNCIIVKDGTHIMILNKFRWFNENLPSLILT